MSAWKKPSRSAWRRKLWITLRPSAGRSRPLRLERGAVVERRAVDPFQREHLARGAVPVHRGHAEVGVVARVLRHLGERGRLQPEIHFHRHRAGERRHRLDRAQPLRFEREAFRLARGVEEGVEIGFEAALDVGPQDFHRHRLVDAVLRDLRPMHLRDRGGGDGGSEAGIDVRHRLAERGGDHGFRLALRKRRHLVLQAFEIARDRLADHVGPGGHELAELDVSRPELGQRGREPARAVFRRGAFEQAGERDCRLGRQRQGARVDQREHALAREHEAGAREAGEMGEGGDHNFQPECSATTPAVMVVNETRRKPAASIIFAKAGGLGNLRIDSTRY